MECESLNNRGKKLGKTVTSIIKIFEIPFNNYYYHQQKHIVTTKTIKNFNYLIIYAKISAKKI